MSSTAALQTSELGKRYGSAWALRDCTLEIPHGRVTALVGPNGAGKTTLLHLAVGLTEPTTGSLRVLGRSPKADAKTLLPRIGFVAQDHPLYRGFTLQELLQVGAKLNPSWDESIARERLGPARARPKTQGRCALRRRASAGGSEPRARQAAGVLAARRAGCLTRSTRTARLPAVPPRGSCRGRDHGAALLAHPLRPRARLRSPCRPLPCTRATRRRDRRDRRGAPAADRATLRARLTRAGRCDRPGEPHRAAIDAARSRQRPPVRRRWTVSEVDLEEIVLAYLAQPSTTYHTAPTPLEVAS